MMITSVWVGAKGRPPQNVPQGHMAYFELKLLKKYSMVEEHIVFLKAEDASPTWTPGIGGWESPLLPKMKVGTKKLIETNFVSSLIYYPSPDSA